jgi:hypothetical protein
LIAASRTSCRAVAKSGTRDSRVVSSCNRIISAGVPAGSSRSRGGLSSARPLCAARATRQSDHALGSPKDRHGSPLARIARRPRLRCHGACGSSFFREASSPSENTRHASLRMIRRP